MHLKNRLDVGEFAVLVEMAPPKGIDISRMVFIAEKIRSKVAAVVVPDMTAAVMRMSPLGAAMILQSKGLETVMQVCCRDRNRLALQGDLLAAYAGGISNVMIVDGQDLAFGDHHQAKAVDDIDGLQLAEALGGLCAGKDMAGTELLGAPAFFFGAEINPGLQGSELERELEKLSRFREAGAGFFITTPIFDLAAMENLADKVDVREANLIPTVMMLKSVGMARYIQRNMPHFHLSDELIRRLQKAPDKVKEAIQVARETLGALREAGFKGAMLAPMGWEQKLPEVLV